MSWFQTWATALLKNNSILPIVFDMAVARRLKRACLCLESCVCVYFEVYLESGLQTIKLFGHFYLIFSMYFFKFQYVPQLQNHVNKLNNLSRLPKICHVLVF